MPLHHEARLVARTTTSGLTGAFQIPLLPVGAELLLRHAAAIPGERAADTKMALRALLLCKRNAPDKGDADMLGNDDIAE